MHLRGESEISEIEREFLRSAASAHLKVFWNGEIVSQRRRFVTELLVEDQQIVIANGASTSIIADGAGIAIGDSSSPIGYIRYKNNSGDPRWEFDPKLFADELEFNVIDCGTFA